MSTPELARVHGLSGEDFGPPIRSTVKKPVFVIGTGRCGTSLLVRILASHPEITVYPTEANELWHPKAYPYSKAKIQAPPILVNPKAFTERSLESWPEKHGDLIKKVLTCFHLLKGESNTFVVKSAMISFMIPKILDLFPDARFIHLYRNGICVVRSLFEKGWQKYLGVIDNERDFYSYAAEYWKQCVMEIDRVSESLSLKGRNIMYELGYEELCREPRTQVDRLSAFLGCHPNGFAFDLSEIRSTNWKVGDYIRDKRWSHLIDVMSTAMEQKGYNV